MHVVHAWKLAGESTLQGSGRLPAQDVSGLLREERASRRDALMNLLRRFSLDSSEARVHLVKGDPVQVIPSLVRDKKIDVVVMGTEARTALRRVLVGDHAEDVLRKVDCSVLTVKRSCSVVGEEES